MQNVLSNPNLWKKVLLGMILGTVVALVHPFSGVALQWIALPGDLFIALLKMIIVPLVLSSVILGVASAGTLDSLRSMGARLVPYFICTTAIAIVIGISITSLVQPGHSISVATATEVVVDAAPIASLTIPDRILNMIPTNPISAQLNKNMLQLVILGLIIGIAMIQFNTESTKTFKHVCEFAQNVCMMIVGWAMWMAPVAVFSLMVKAVSNMGVSALQGMGLYVLSVICGLLAVLVFYLLIVSLIARRNPLRFLASIRSAQIIAFSSSSSAATMPVSLTVAKERLKISEDVRGFVIPLGATINMDGTALYQAAAALFLCQAFGIDLSIGETVLLLLVTVGASIGTPAMPGVGLIVLATVLNSIGVPPEGIGMILGVDRLLDMCRTTINVTGDLTATTVMQRWMEKRSPASSES